MSAGGTESSTNWKSRGKRRHVEIRELLTGGLWVEGGLLRGFRRCTVYGRFTVSEAPSPRPLPAGDDPSSRTIRIFSSDPRSRADFPDEFLGLTITLCLRLYRRLRGISSSVPYSDWNFNVEVRTDWRFC